jgi:hypothetical protein
MSDFINTIDVLGDDAVVDSIINRTITEFKDNVITTVGKYAFYKCTALETVDLPNVTMVSQNAFTNCNVLVNVNLTNAEKIYSSAFEGCSSLIDIATPKVSNIDANVFKNCTSLKCVSFPLLKALSASVFNGCAALETADFHQLTSINTSVFYGCANLTKLILRNADSAVTLADTSSFTRTAIESGAGHIYVPKALLPQYTSATNWSTYANQFRAIEDYPEITGG